MDKKNYLFDFTKEEIKSVRQIDTEKITRIEVIDKTGRAYVKWDCKIQASVQDNGRTLKIFVDEK